MSITWLDRGFGPGFLSQYVLHLELNVTVKVKL